MSEAHRHTTTIDYQPLSPAHFAAVIALGNQVHGDGYLTAELINTYYQQGKDQYQGGPFSHRLSLLGRADPCRTHEARKI